MEGIIEMSWVKLIVFVVVILGLVVWINYKNEWDWKEK
jgi:hypothetical protein